MRLYDFGDDGHAIKQARATAMCHELMTEYKDKPWAALKDESIWNKIQHMVVDAVEGPGVLYVRSTGFDEAWKVNAFMSSSLCIYADSNARKSLVKTRRRDLLTFCTLYRLEVVAHQKLSDHILSSVNC